LTTASDCKNRPIIDPGFERQLRQKIELSRQARRHRQAKMLKGCPGQHAATRRALHETLLEQVRLDDFFDDVALVAECGRDRLDPDRAARIILSNAAQVAPVHPVEAAGINVEPLQRSISGQCVNARQAVDRSEVADAAQQADRDARGAP
jgi:hypothetical protein